MMFVIKNSRVRNKESHASNDHLQNGNNQLAVAHFFSQTQLKIELKKEELICFYCFKGLTIAYVDAPIAKLE